MANIGDYICEVLYRTRVRSQGYITTVAESHGAGEFATPASRFAILGDGSGGGGRRDPGGPVGPSRRGRRRQVRGGAVADDRPPSDGGHGAVAVDVRHPAAARRAAGVDDAVQPRRHLDTGVGHRRRTRSPNGA